MRPWAITSTTRPRLTRRSKPRSSSPRVSPYRNLNYPSSFGSGPREHVKCLWLCIWTSTFLCQLWNSIEDMGSICSRLSKTASTGNSMTKCWSELGTWVGWCSLRIFASRRWPRIGNVRGYLSRGCFLVTQESFWDRQHDRFSECDDAVCHPPRTGRWALAASVGEGR